MPRYLVGRISDPLLGISTGILAYVLWENDGRNAVHRPEGRMLIDLLRRKWNGEAPPPSTPAAAVSTASSASSSSAPTGQTKMV